MAQRFTMPRTSTRIGKGLKRPRGLETTFSTDKNNGPVNPLMQMLSQTTDTYINTTTNTISHHEVFIDAEITEPENYRELISLLFNANEGDSVTLFINSGGGNLDTALAIIEGLKNTQAHVIAAIIGACHSAASFISMYAHEVAVLASAYMMVHTATFGSVGMTGNVKAHTDFTVRQVEKLINETYEGFLTAVEITKVKAGVELWFSADDIKERMIKRVKHLDTVAKKKAKSDLKAEK
jgi:ATP-dependent protease ClpP protease subunit